MEKTRLNFISVVIVLSMLGLLGNYISLPLSFGVDFIFGSVAALLAIRLAGLSAGVIIAIVVSSYTYFAWGHPYAMIIFTSEALVVGFLSRRNITSLVLADIIYWLLIGMPLVWIFYSGVIGMPQTQALLILLKQPVNGIANAVLATYLLLLVPQKYFLNRNEDMQGNINLKELLFSTFLGIALLVSFAIIHYENKLTIRNFENALSAQLQQFSENLTYNNNDVINELANLKNDMRLKKYHFDLIVEHDNKIIFSTLPDIQSSDFISVGTKNKINDELSIWMPERNKMPLMLWWNKAYYFLTAPSTQKFKGNIYILQKSGLTINRVQNEILLSLKLLFILVLIAGIVSYVISRYLTNTIIQLTDATKNLPEKLQRNIIIDWPKSNITELQQLSRQTEEMSEKISDTFDDVTLQATTILESSIDSIITIDTDGMLLNFNSAAEKLFGFAKNEILNTNVKILMPDQTNDINAEYLDNLLHDMNESGLSDRIELTAKHKDGRLIPIEFSLTKTQLNNNITYTAIITDISKRKANEQLKRDFISTVSHELRTPLTSINGSVKLIYAQQGSITPDGLASLLDVTCRNVDRLTVLINDLLDFERLQSAAMEYAQEDINTSEFIAEVLEQNTGFAQQANIKFKKNIQCNGNIRADLKRLTQVMTNLLSNAVKFSAENDVVEVGCVTEQDKIKIYVKDNGIGISEEFKSRIFERFSQGDSADNRKIQRGTGLGLAISKRMTEDMGGVIGFDSVEGQGSTFYILFRVAS
ncbi:MAG: ATP-binding protein [Gammaproteobacteria bacterium]|nr:ATP-binding protein [Gammaproteobacteria bacterium]